MFKPTYYFDGIEKIDIKFLKKNKIKGLIMDVDNTIIDSHRVIRDEKMKWIGEIHKAGIKICILSNSSKLDKVSTVANSIGVPYLLNGMKPAKKGFNMAIDILELKKEDVAIVGDQIFTDVWGGNRFGIKSILVEPFDIFEPFWVKAKRPIEKMITKKIEFTNSKG